MQVCPSLNTSFPLKSPSVQQQVVAHMIQRQRAALDPPAAAPTAATYLCNMLTDGMSTDVDVKRQRVALLTPLLTDAVKSAEGLFNQEFGVLGLGHLVCTVSRALKAWSKFGFAGIQPNSRQDSAGTASKSGILSSGGGSSSSMSSFRMSLPAQSQQQQQGSSSAASVRPPGMQPWHKYPPGFIWEVLVLYVLRQKLEQHRSTPERYATDGRRELTLFLEVLEAASQLLRPRASNTAPAVISLTHPFAVYTAEELELFRGVWGAAGAPTPIIIHPGDPSFNCAAFTPFQGWSALADAAGRLHAQLQSFMQLEAGNAENVQRRVLDETSLGAAVRAFATSNSG